MACDILTQSSLIDRPIAHEQEVGGLDDSRRAGADGCPLRVGRSAAFSCMPVASTIVPTESNTTVADGCDDAVHELLDGGDRRDGRRRRLAPAPPRCSARAPATMNPMPLMNSAALMTNSQ